MAATQHTTTQAANRQARQAERIAEQLEAANAAVTEAEAAKREASRKHGHAWSEHEDAARRVRNAESWLAKWNERHAAAAADLERLAPLLAEADAERIAAAEALDAARAHADEVAAPALALAEAEQRRQDALARIANGTNGATP